MQWKPNATVAAIVEDEGRFLLVEEDIEGKIVYNQPAGHLEQGESLLEAVKREVLEETARDFEPELLTGVYLYPNPANENITYLRFCFYGHCTKEYPDRPLDDGILRAVWLSQDEIREEQDRMRSPMVTKCIEDYLNGQQYSLDILHHYIK